MSVIDPAIGDPTASAAPPSPIPATPDLSSLPTVSGPAPGPDAQPQPAAPPQQAAQPGSKWANVLKGALLGLMEGGIPGAVAGGVRPDLAREELANRRQTATANANFATSRADYMKAKAAEAITDAYQQHVTIERQDELWKERQSDRAIGQMTQFQATGLAPREIGNDSQDDAMRIVRGIMATGGIPFTLHIPSPDGQHGQIAVYDLKPLITAPTIPAAAKEGLAMLNQQITDEQFAKMTPEQRLGVIQAGLQGINFNPAGTPKDILTQINSLQSAKRVYAVAHVNDPNLKSKLAQYDSIIQSLSQARANLVRGESQEAGAIEGAKAQAKVGPAIATARGEAQAKADIEGRSAGGGSTDALGFAVPPMDGGVKEYNLRQRAFKKNADSLAQTEQTFRQFGNILSDIDAGKDLTGAQSVVGLFNAIGISAEPLKGKGFRINNNTVEEHVQARGLGEGLYQKLLRLQKGDIITPQQLKDYASIAARARHDAYVTAVNEAHNEGLKADFLLPNGNGNQLDSSTASIFLELTGGNKDQARQAAAAKGWKF